MRIRSIQLAIQEFLFQLETSIIDKNLKFVIELLDTFTGSAGSNYLIPSAESFDRAKASMRDEICEELDASKPLVDKLENL
jgi:hypothetical protein